MSSGRKRFLLQWRRLKHRVLQPMRGCRPISANRAGIVETGNEMYETGASPQKPFLAQGPGQAAAEVWNMTANAATALVTDYLDLGAGVGDTFVQGGNLLQGKGFDFNSGSTTRITLGQKADLLLFEPQTQVGEMQQPWIRGGVALLTLPKKLLRWGLVKPIKAAAGVPVFGKERHQGRQQGQRCGQGQGGAIG